MGNCLCHGSTSSPQSSLQRANSNDQLATAYQELQTLVGTGLETGQHASLEGLNAFDASNRVSVTRYLLEQAQLRLHNPAEMQEIVQLTGVTNREFARQLDANKQFWQAREG